VDAKVAYWMHRVDDCLAVIETVALQQFRCHKNSMEVHLFSIFMQFFDMCLRYLICIHPHIQIFLEMVLAKKQDKLLNLAKTDKSNTGRQLCSLMAIDFTINTEKTTNIARKNAFALIRLQRYKHAAAAFLCAVPPLLKEACNVLVRYCEDAPLAFLVARIVEETHSPDAPVRPNGLFLGPVARSIMTRYLLSDDRTNSSNTTTDDEVAGFNFIGRLLLQEAGPCKQAVTKLCHVWGEHLQHPRVSSVSNGSTSNHVVSNPVSLVNSKHVHQSLLATANLVSSDRNQVAGRHVSLSDICMQSTHSLFHMIRLQMLTSALLCLPAHLARNVDILSVMAAVDRQLQHQCLLGDRESWTRYMAEFVSQCSQANRESECQRGWGCQHFSVLVETVMKEYRAHKIELERQEQLRLQKEAAEVENEDDDVSDDEEKEGAITASIPTEKPIAPTVVEPPAVIIPKQTGFNLAYMTTQNAASKPAAATSAGLATPNALDMFDSFENQRSTRPQQPRTTAAAPSALDMFDFQAPNRSSKTPASLLSSSASTSSSAAEQGPSALDAFDFQSPSRTTGFKYSSARDSGSSRNASNSASAAVPSALDMFDYQPPNRSTKASASTVSPTPAVPNMLDAFDFQPPSRSSSRQITANIQTASAAVDVPKTASPAPAASALDVFDLQPGNRRQSNFAAEFLAKRNANAESGSKISENNNGVAEAPLSAESKLSSGQAVPNALDIFDYQPRRR
jgi:hypothetical protein